MAWLAGWSHAKDIVITGQAGSGTDYQVELEIGDSAGGDFHLEGKCTNFPQDIEVTDNDGTTLLDFWIEDIAADPIVMHVEVADDLGSNQTIRVYYDKNGASTNSDGAATFLQYHGAATVGFIDSLVINPANPIVFESRSKSTSATHNVRWGVANNQPQPEIDDSLLIISYSGGNNRYILSSNEGITSSFTEAPKFVTNTYYKLKIISTGSAVTGYIDGNQIGVADVTTNLPNETLGIFMDAHTGTCVQDWSFVRKYNDPEPAFASAGAEQNAPAAGGARPSRVFYGPFCGPFGGPIQ